MFKVVRTFTFPGALEIEKEIFDNQLEIIVTPSATEDELIENCRDADAVICAYEPFTKRVIDALPKLKLIAFGTIGFNYADVDYARKKNIPVTHISQYCVKEVADYTAGMLIMLNRMILPFNKSVKEDLVWDYNLFPAMRRLENQTVGLLGFGNISRLVTQRLRPFGCRVIAYDPFVSDEKAAEYGVELLSFDDVLQQSDLISLHLPANQQTKEIINNSSIAKMKDGVILVNAARGQVVNEDAIVHAIDSGKMAYYAADVLQEEDPNLQTHPFVQRENIILTPHIAYYSQESLREATAECAMNVKHFAEGDYSKCQIVNNVRL
ncbi:phosphoglycerate dehydrogenase family protein [Sporosarcina sp. P18a]|uniref:C-terminal binding protein n=1 Tax=Sporosarcina sp. P18a TaxID=2048259 RepID=UPI000C16C0D6|nr:C-terminal binding protein [Sporosarcina sp. P18a]PIC80002.1 phosphoglycerate dehydrogenase family protein [Sporosarcina sp. P18a]